MAPRNPPEAGPLPHPARGPDWTVLAGGALIALAGIAAYAGTLGVPFVLDDRPSIVDNPSIRHWGSALWAPSATTPGGRPLLNLSLALNYAIGGTSLAGYHAVNLLIHILAALTLLGILRRTFPLLHPMREFPPLLPLAITLLWTLHPLQTESVTYVIQRAESLMGLFYLLTLYFFIRSVGSEGPARAPGFSPEPSARMFQVLGIASCLCCVATKEVSATLPLLVLLFDRTFVAGSFREAWARRGRFHLCLFAAWIPLAALVLSTHGRAATAGIGSGVSAAAYARVQFAAIPHYLRLCLWPHPLVFDYGTCLAFSNDRVVFGAAVLIALAVATGWALVRRPAAGFLGTWFLAILAPSSSVIPVATEPMAEHRMYLPLAAVAVAFAVGLHALLGKRCVPVLLALAAALGWATARRNGDYRSEEVLWRTTLAARPGNERARNNLGNVLAASPGRLDDAIAEYREAVRLRPEYAEAHFNLGCALERTPGGLAGAIAAYREAVRLKPDFAEAHNNLGSALERLPGGSAEAMANFEAALRLKPGYAEARNNLGGALLDVPGRLDEATAQFREALRLQPGNPAAHVNLAVALLMANRPGQAREAIASLREALRLDPGNAAARALLEREGQGAMTAPTEGQREDFVRKVCLVGLKRIREKRFDEAVIAFQAALELKPGYADAYNDLGTAHQFAGRVDEAAAAYQEALRINPDHPKAWSNLGTAHMQRNEPLLAIAAYERAIALNRFNAKIRTNLAFARLLIGDLLAGWRHYEARWAAGSTGVRRIGTRRPWLGGRSIRGRSILICNEQGLGDMMQFSRFVPLVVAMGAKVHLEAPPALVRLFAVSFPGVEAVHSTEGPVPDCDEICTVPSLALAFATELHTIPSKVPYLAPPPGAPALLPARTPGVPRIGLAWSGFAGHTNDANRSVPFERFRMIPDGMPFEFICLQKEIRRRDQAALSASGVPSFTDRIGDFADTAGLVGEVDLVIAVDTSIAHLAGAMGRPTWVLLPYVPDWRWMLGRADCPWYPTMRLFRQPRAGDWEAVFTEVLAALRDWAPR